MTKIKNTKKGMAKKTLSMSLVVAMLATSNVPVWAAEFSDGSDVSVQTEVFSDESETPAVEDFNNSNAENAKDVSAEATITGTGVTGNEIKSDAKNLTVTTTEGASKTYSYKLAIILDKKEKIIGTLNKNGEGKLQGNITEDLSSVKTLTCKIYSTTEDNAETATNWDDGKEVGTYTIVGASADEYAAAGKDTSITIAGESTIGKTLKATFTQGTMTNTTGKQVGYQWYRGTTPIGSATDVSYTITEEDLGCELTVKAYVSSGTETYGDITLAKASTTVTSKTADAYVNSDKITVKSPTQTWKDAKNKTADDLFDFTNGYLKGNATNIKKSLSVKKDGNLYALKGTDADKDAVICPVITFNVPGIAETFTYEVTNKTVTVSDITSTEVTNIALADMQWKDSVDGTLLERGKMPEYTYKNSSKESYHPVLAKVWIGQKEYKIGDQNVEATYTYNPDSITELGGAAKDCTVEVALKIGSLEGKISQTYKVKAVSFKETDITWPTSLTYAPAKELNEAATNATSVSGLIKYDGDNADKAQYKVEVTTGTDKAIVTVTGMNEYAGTSFQKEVAVAKYNIANAYVAPIDDQTYTGRDVTPVFTVKYNNEKGSEFKSGTDYTVVYQKNRDAGTTSIIITGTGMCEGTKTINFNIVSKTFSDASPLYNFLNKKYRTGTF